MRLWDECSRVDTTSIPTQAATGTADNTLHGRHPRGAALIAPEDTPCGSDPRDPDFLAFASGASPWFRAYVRCDTAILSHASRLQPAHILRAYHLRVILLERLWL